MYEREMASGTRERPRVTVAAVVQRDSRFLFVLERAADGRLVINQPAGHLERGESLMEAVVRETREETGWHFVPEAVVGVYQWQHSIYGPNYVRFAVCGEVTVRDEAPQLDEGIEDVLWLDWHELNERSDQLRSPLVRSVVADYLAGERYPTGLIKVVHGPVAS
ncbi:NUDIX hydrolase [Methylolobus aquaticus]|uniref:NUDIX hydrolase n=1 Tax=Methylotetracoccus oryzae TaxID=1919059 RepID=UPI001020EBF1|nr:NUDIX hydrolase [Methylotetracoccus oryzae]RYU61937.1 NUDIX hydrolase [Methylolobus aquaticus]